MSEAAIAWRKISEAEKAKYNELASKDAERYQTERAAYLKEQELIAPPKRNMSAYLIFFIENRLRMIQENPSLPATQVASESGKMWKAMSDAEKKPYLVRAGAEKEKYEKEYAQWKAEQ